MLNKGTEIELMKGKIDQNISNLLDLKATLDGKNFNNNVKKGKVRVITYGTFDMIHAGHIRLLERAKALGDELIVAVSTDELNEFKHKEARVPFADRAKVVEALSMVDKVIPEADWQQKPSDMRKYNIDKFVMGDDWRGEFDYLEDLGVQVIYLPRTEGISTTQLKAGLSKEERAERNKKIMDYLDE